MLNHWKADVQVVFRTDASVEIGTGHVMRCLTLADALHKKGAYCRFVSRDHAGNLFDMVRERGFEVLALPFAANEGASRTTPAESLPAHAAWLRTGWANDARQTFEAFGDTLLDWLVVDHYAIDARWETLLRSTCRHLMVIDDLADRQHDCDLLLDQNLGHDAADYSELVPADCNLRIGPRYALLRPEFAALRSYSLARRDEPRIKQILITMGGIDSGNATSNVLDALKACPLPTECHICVVLGIHAPWLDMVREKAEAMPWSTEVLVNVTNMAELMAASDLAIGAAGGTALEMCCMGLPALIGALADNQRKVAESLTACGATMQFESTVGMDLRGELGALMNRERLMAMQRASARITDGSGAAHMAFEIVQLN